MLARGVPMALAAACRRAPPAPRGASASAAPRRWARAASAAPPPPPPAPLPGRAPRRLASSSSSSVRALSSSAGAADAAAAPPAARKGPTFQQAVSRLQEFWASVGCAVYLPHNTEVGAGTMNPATFLRVLGPEPWNVAYPEPSIRPDDSRYGDNPNRVQRHTQFQARRVARASAFLRGRGSGFDTAAWARAWLHAHARGANACRVDPRAARRMRKALSVMSPHAHTLSHTRAHTHALTHNPPLHATSRR
jgi:hypothetical protein